MDTKIFHLLDLSEYEIKAYLALVNLGNESKAFDVAFKSGVPYSRIYDVLKKLETKKLVSVIPKTPKRYIALPPIALKEIVEKKQEKLRIIEEEIKKIENEVKAEKPKNNLVVVRGRKGFNMLIRSLPPAKRFSYTIRWKANPKKFYILRNIRNSKSKIDHKILFDYNISKSSIEKYTDTIKDYDFIKSNGVAVGIDENGVLISIVGIDSTILIRSREFSEVMKQLFEGYYNYRKLIKDTTK